MRDPEAGKALAILDRELYRARVLAFYGDRGFAASQACQTLCAEAVSFEIVGDAVLHPFVGRRFGRAGMVEALRAFNIDLECLGAKVEEVLIDADRVAVRRLLALRHRGSGRRVEVRCFDYFSFDLGAISAIVLFMDTAKVSRVTDRLSPV